jgi:hypothetical protein
MHKLWAAGAAVLGCLVLSGVPAMAQDMRDYTAVAVTGTQACAESSSDEPVWDCTYTASDPRVAGTGTIRFRASVSDRSSDGPVMWVIDTTLDGPDGTWSGHHYVFTDQTGVAHVLMMLAGAGAYEGWQYVASATDPEADGNHDLVGLLYEGDAPPYGPLPTG